MHKAVSNLIERNSNETLKLLSIHQFLQNENDISRMLLSISNITKLELVSCAPTLDAVDLLNNYQSIEVLILNSYGHWIENEPLVQHYCTLSNIHLQVIILRYSFPLQIIRLLDQIDLFVPNLTELEINEIIEEPRFEASLTNTVKLDKLKVLTINFNGENAVPLFEQCDKNISFEKLTVINTTNVSITNKTDKDDFQPSLIPN